MNFKANKPVVNSDNGKFSVGAGQKCFVIAEAGVNHNGSLDLAFKLIDEAAASGADAVKFQTYHASDVISKNAPKAEYQLRQTGEKESQLEMSKKLELPFDAFNKLASYCREKHIEFMSSPFDLPSIDFLADVEIPFLKIPSGEVINFQFLERAARLDKPIILSTGMSTLIEVEEAVACIYKAGNNNLVLLHCVSNYPADPKDVNLRAMQTMRDHFGIPVGFSDHTLGLEITWAAVSLGASVIEKHFTLDKNMPGPDHQASLDPAELKHLVEGIRKIERAMGSGIKEPVLNEKNTAMVARKSIVAAIDIKSGTKITKKMLAIKRPGTGLMPSQLDSLIGRQSRMDITTDTLISIDMLV